MLRKMWSGGEVQAWIDALPPLYTHPVKELTDEEMEALEYLIEQYGNCRFMEGNTGMNLSEMSDEILERFKSILRKAQE